MHDEEIDKLFREDSKVNFSEEIPEEFLVDINQRLDVLSQNRKKRPLFMWWFAGCILFAGLAFAGYKSITLSSSQLAENNVTKIKSKHKVQNQISFNSTSTKNQSNAISSEPTILESRNSLKFSKNKTKLIASQSSFLQPLDTKTSLDIPTTKIIVPVNPARIEESIATLILESENSANIDSVFHKTDVVISDSTSKQESEVVTIEPEMKTEKKSKKLIQMEIGFYSGVSVINSSFKIPNDVANSVVGLNLDEYRQRREREEVATTSWDLALRYKLLVNNFSFQSGLDYFQWGEEIRYDYNSISGINRYSYLNIPLNFGYNFQFNKFGINPYAGVSIGFGFKRDGRYLQPDLQTVSQVQSQKIIGNYQVGTEFSYLSESNFKFSVTPIFRSSINEVVKSDVIHNKYVSIGLQIGFSYAW